MTWTFNGAPDTSSTGGRRDAVRLMIPDINASVQLVTDEAIAFWLSQSGNNLYRAAARACRTLADAGAGSQMSVGDLSISGSVDSWASKAGRYDREADMSATPFAGGITLSDREARDADTDRLTPAFVKDQDRTPGLVDDADSPRAST